MELTEETSRAATGEPVAEPAGEPPILSVLLVAYNSRRFLEGCLGALERHISLPYEIVLVDNGSSDGTVDFIRERYPAVRLIQSERNLGFTGGNNLAARESRGTYLLLLNCDTVLLTDVAAGIHILESDPHVGVVGARMYGAHGEHRANTGHFPAPWRLWKFTLQWSDPMARPYGPPDFSAFRHDWVEGSCLLTTRQNWQEVGGMDESGFMYAEDVEFCGHTWQQGRISVQCTKMMYLHFGGYTVDRMEYLYAGYRRFHASCSDLATQRRADRVLRLGLIPRILVFGILSRVTGKEHFKRKYERFLDVRRRWRELAPRPSTRVPLCAAEPTARH